MWESEGWIKACRENLTRVWLPAAELAVGGLVPSWVGLPYFAFASLSLLYWSATWRLGGMAW